MMVRVPLCYCSCKIHNRYTMTGARIERFISIGESAAVPAAIAYNTNYDRLKLIIQDDGGKPLLFKIVPPEKSSADPAVRIDLREYNSVKEGD